MTKAEKIQEAWIMLIGADLYVKCKLKIDPESGTLSAKYLCYHADFVAKDFDSNSYDSYSDSLDSYWRPTELRGIENNNGWIKIEIESDLPETNSKIHLRDERGSISKDHDFIVGAYNPEQYIKNYTHWRPSENLPQPLY